MGVLCVQLCEIGHIRLCACRGACMATFTTVLCSISQCSEYVGHPDESLARKKCLLTASYTMQVQGESKDLHSIL